MIIAETKRLLLRTWTLDDLSAGMNIWGDKDVIKYLGLERPMTKEEVLDSIKRGIDHQIKYGYQHWAVVSKETGELIGACGFSSFKQYREQEVSIELAFHFVQKAWGYGYASEAAEACLDYAHDNLKIDRIVAGVEEGNIRSIRILNKLGFRYLGLVYFDDTKTFEPMYEFRMTPKKRFKSDGGKIEVKINREPS